MQDADITIKPRDVMPAGATTLPAEFYTDQARFRVEMERLFTQDWICAGRVEQVEAPGQFFLRYAEPPAQSSDDRAKSGFVSCSIILRGNREFAHRSGPS